MKVRNQLVLAAISVSISALLIACGGGGGSSPAATTTTVPITVVDGPIQNATVCLDKNSNRFCDAGEPFGKTDVNGKVNLTVDLVDTGKYPVIAVVGIDAVDADWGNVPVPFTMSSPADRAGVVSPLTTLVQQLKASTGVSTADAAASVQAATGITVSLFDDFTKATVPTDGSISAATVARMVIVTTQRQATAIASALGTTATDGSTITSAHLDLAVQKKLMELLPNLVVALSDPTVLNAADKEAALQAAASTLVSNAGLSPGSIATVVAINTQSSSTTPVVPATPSAGFSLASLNFTDASNYYHRVFSSTVAQNTPDSSGNTKYVERRARSSGGALARWGSGGDPWRQSDLHWNGSAWANCPINFENTSSARDALGNSAYNYCDHRETGKSTRATFDIDLTKTMAELYTQVRAAGFTNLSIADPTVLGTAKFPAGSTVSYQTSTPITSAISYYPGGSFPVGNSNLVTQYTSEVSNGGVASTQGAGVGCNSAEFQNTNGTNSTTLEGMMSAMTGTPCEFTGGSFVYGGVTYTNPDAPRNEGWGQSTVGIGIVGSAPVGTGPAPGFFTTNTKLRIAFTGPGTNPVTYYACKERFNNGSTRNCTSIGTGSYAVATLGDARVMTLNNLPAQASALSYTRVFVERKGVIYQGYQNKPSASNSVRLNTVAATALLTQLGLTPDDPSVPLALTAGSYQGTWDLHDPLFPDGTTVFFWADGSNYCQSSAGVAQTCTFSITNPATGAFTFSGPNSTANGTLNASTGTGGGTYINLDSTTGNFVAQRR